MTDIGCAQNSGHQSFGGLGVAVSLETVEPVRRRDLPIDRVRSCVRQGNHAAGRPLRRQEPHSLHRSAVAGDVPSTSETPRHVTLTATEVKQCLLFSDQMQPLRLGERCRKMLRLVIFKAYL